VAALPADGQLEIFEGAGHLLTVEQPEEFEPVLLAFLERVAT
jgi:pimeloyl-ACP methyl ester carboxylesterase